MGMRKWCHKVYDHCEHIRENVTVFFLFSFNFDLKFKFHKIQIDKITIQNVFH